MKSDFIDGAITFFLEGRIDSNNAADIETEIMDESPLFEGLGLTFDAAGLDYISSAGLRTFLKIKGATGKEITIKNVSDEVFDILDVTGFGEIFNVERKMRTISVRGCKKISSALNGEILQLSDDEMIKVYDASVGLKEVKDERDHARTAMIYGVPTLIPYDVVKCEKGYGIVFEKAEMTSLAYLISHNPDTLGLYAGKLGMMLKDLHTIKIPEGKLPNIKDRYRQWIKEVDDPADSQTAVFSQMIESIPDSDTYVHGDINLNSVMVRDNEILLLDMSGSAYGSSIFDMAALFASLVAIEAKQEGYCRKTFGLSKATCLDFWKRFFSSYMGDRADEIGTMNQLLLKYFVLKQNVLNKVEKKHRVGV